MKRGYWLIGLLISSFAAFAQPARERLAMAAKKMQADEQMKYGILGLSVVNSASGETVFEWNPQIGLAPASCQKIITSATALELLGPQYRYRTELAYDGIISNGVLKGNLHITGYGDPSLGSWRYDSTREDLVLNRWLMALKAMGIRKINGSLIAHTDRWDSEKIPGGWIWDDIGNYYGAGASALNWRENQYDIALRSGNMPGDRVAVIKTVPELYKIQFENELRAGVKGSGDNAYIYLPVFGQRGVLRGTIPAGEPQFVISGAMPEPAIQLLFTLAGKMGADGMNPASFFVSGTAKQETKPIHTHFSPGLDSINYWFLRKSVNLYGESFLRALSFEKDGSGSTGKGVQLIKAFWKERGIDPAALRIMDGSGLSPQNRVTADALVKVLQYAHSRPWFSYYYDAFPVYNQMKLKSGTIGGAKAYAGYHTAKDGTGYTVAIIVNNYSGSANEIVKKMFLVLDELK